MFTIRPFPVLILIYLFGSVKAQYRFGCKKDFCTKDVGPCPEVDCEGGRLIKNATTCGCCDICVVSLKKGDKCKTQAFASLPRQECGPGLTCDKRKLECVPAKTKCIEEQEVFDYEFRRGVAISRERPNCNEFGYYEPVVCISDVVCHCVDKNDGRRIFGTDIASRKDFMHCNCSQEFNAFPRNVPMNDFLRCLANGNYDSLQCSDEWCYCMQDTSQEHGYVIKANTNLKNLLCYDKDLHQHNDALLRSKCWKKRLSLLQEIKKHEDGNVTVIGVDLPECDLDGSYSPVQCKKERCYCVKKDGDNFEGYEVQRYSDEAKNMNCECVRDKDLVENEESRNEKMKTFLQNTECDKNGNYKNDEN